MLRKGDLPTVKALVEKMPQVLDARDGESHAYWVRAEVIEKFRPAGLKKYFIGGFG